MPKLRNTRDHTGDDFLIGTIRKYAYLSGVDTKGLALVLNMSEGTLYNRFKRPSGFQLSELRTLIKKLHIPADDITSIICENQRS